MSMKTTNEGPPLELLGSGAGEDYERTDPEVYVPSGLAPLDALILGAVAGECLLIAGAPSQGKTALAMQWAINAASNHALKTAVLSMEMGKRALRNRLVSGMTGIPMTVLRTRQFASAQQRGQAKSAGEYLASIPLYVDDRSGLDANAAYSTITGWGRQGIGLAIVDYLQLMSGLNESRVTQVGDAIRSLKAAAKAADVPLIVVSSLNRNASRRDSVAPKLSDLRDSGDIEYVADTILMFSYPEEDYYDDIRAADIHVMKQRNGPTGVLSVRFNKPQTRFEEVK